MGSVQAVSTSRLMPAKGDGPAPCRAGGVPLSGEFPKSLLQSESRRGVVTCPQSDTVMCTVRPLRNPCEIFARVALREQSHKAHHDERAGLGHHSKTAHAVQGEVQRLLPGCAACWAAGQASLKVSVNAPGAG